MQQYLLQIRKPYNPIHKKVNVLQALSNLYLAINDRNNYTEVQIPKELKQYAEILYLNNNQDPSLIKANLILTKPKYKTNHNLSICMFTGGKDSLASRIKYEAMTKDIKTFHIKGLNTLYPQETKTFKELDSLQLHIDIAHIKLPRLLNQKEHPMKNLLTHVLAIEYYKALPKYFNFGFITFKGCTTSVDILLDEWYQSQEYKNTHFEIKEKPKKKLSKKKIKEIEEEIELDTYTESELNPLSCTTSTGSPQVSEIGGDGEVLSVMLYIVLKNFYGKLIKNTSGMPDTVETFRLLKDFGIDKKLKNDLLYEFGV